MSKVTIIPDPSEEQQNQQTINTIYSGWSAYFSRIADSLENIEEDIDRLRVLADHPNGPGIRTIQPYEEFTLSVLYSLYVKQAQAIADPDASAAGQAESLQKIQSIINEIKSTLGNGFD